MRKTTAIILATATATAMVLSSGCAGGNPRNLASLASNWYIDSTFKGIQPTFTEGNPSFSGPEKLTFRVVQAAASSNPSYSVEYANGTYTTEFYAKKLGLADLERITDENTRADYVKETGSDGSLVVYYYTTLLTMPSVTFGCNGESVTFENDWVFTESCFLSVKDFLSPVYSKKQVHSATPDKISPNSLEDCYRQYDRVYESFYSFGGSDVRTEITDNLAQNDEDRHSEFSTGGMTAKNTNSAFDSSYLDVVVRAMKNMTPSLTQAISLYSPGMSVRNFNLSGGELALADNAESSSAQLKEIAGVLQANGLFTPEENALPQTVSVTVRLDSSNFAGVTSTYWFAVDGSNTSRTLPVKIACPLTYNLGRLEYLLQSVESLPA